MKTMTKRWIVVLDNADSLGPVYLGELDPGVRQGVRKRDNALRFTRTGAARVARGYAGAQAMHEVDAPSHLCPRQLGSQSK